MRGGPLPAPRRHRRLGPLGVPALAPRRRRHRRHGALQRAHHRTAGGGRGAAPEPRASTRRSSTRPTTSRSSRTPAALHHRQCRPTRGSSARAPTRSLAAPTLSSCRPEAPQAARRATSRALRVGGLVIWRRRSAAACYESRKFPVELADGASAWAATCATSPEQRRAEGEIRRLATELERARRAAHGAARGDQQGARVVRVLDLARLARAAARARRLQRDPAARTTARRSTSGRGYLRRIKGAASHMAGLMDGLLQLSRLNREELAFQDVDLTALATSFVAELRELDPARDVDVDIATGLIAEADPKLLRVALENLLGNAWKFTSRHDTALIEVGAAARHAGGDAARIASSCTTTAPASTCATPRTSSAPSSGCTRRTSSRARASGSPPCSASSTATAAPCGRRARSRRAPPSGSRWNRRTGA